MGEVMHKHPLPLASQRLSGKVALVTGAGSGIGRATAVRFALEGARVVVADIDVEAARQTVELIGAVQGESLAVGVNVAEPASVEAMIGLTLQRFGRLVCAHNNAGVDGEQSLTADCTEANWDRLMAVNLKGVWWCMKFELPQLLKQGGGSIVNTSSVAGLVGLPMDAAYAAAKHGIIGLTKTAALEYAPYGIRVNAVCPGLTKTPMVDRLSAGQPQMIEALAKTLPMRRAGDPNEVAETVVWLCSDAASYVTGVALPVDGGLVSQ